MSKPKIMIILAAVAAALLFAGCADTTTDTTSSDSNASRLQSAYDACTSSEGVSAMDGITVADGGDSVIVDGVSDVAGIGCILGTIGAPESLVANMDSTTAMMGRQHESHDGLDYDWSYHPDNGFNMTITD